MSDSDFCHDLEQMATIWFRPNSEEFLMIQLAIEKIEHQREQIWHWKAVAASREATVKAFCGPAINEME